MQRYLIALMNVINVYRTSVNIRPLKIIEVEKSHRTRTAEIILVFEFRSIKKKCP